MNARDKNFTRAKLKKRMEQIEASIECYLSALETADCREGEVAEAKAARLKDKIASLRDQMRKVQHARKLALEPPLRSLRQIVDHCCDAWNKLIDLIDQPWRIMSIGMRKWLYRF